MSPEDCRHWNESGFSPQCNQSTEVPTVPPEVHTVPLPATPLLLLLGFAVLCAVVRRK